MNGQSVSDGSIKEFGEELSNPDIPVWQGITPKDRLLLAKWILLAAVILFFLSGLAFLLSPEHGAVIFDACKTILPPIVTLILGYYFGESKSGN